MCVIPLIGSDLPFVTHCQGSDGAWYASSPGSAIDAISVASVDKYVRWFGSRSRLADRVSSIVLPLQKVVLGGVEKDPGIIYYSTYPLPIPTLPIYVLSNDTTNPTDACEPLPDDTPDLSKFLVIIRRGTCPFVSRNSEYEIDWFCSTQMIGSKAHQRRGQGRKICIDLRVRVVIKPTKFLRC